MSNRERLWEVVREAHDEWYSNRVAHTDLSKHIAARLEQAGVTVPEEEIPVPDEALRRILEVDTGLSDARYQAIVRAAYPHIAAAVIDALPYTLSGYIRGGGPVSRQDLHTALRSSKA